MKFVVIRDDDTNATTPVGFLERLYAPFIDRGLPVSLATIPHVAIDARTPDGLPEAFVVRNGTRLPPFIPLASNPRLCEYLRTRGFEILQHGLSHERPHGEAEFNIGDRVEVIRRLEEGTRHLNEAGFARPQTFVGPYDLISAVAFEEIACRFRIISTGWYERRRLPRSWLPSYIGKKVWRKPHWSVGRTLLLSHSGCLLSRNRPYEGMLERVRKAVLGQQLTVLVTHWWEYFPDGAPDERLIAVLHETADFLASRRDVRVFRFSDLDCV